MTRTELTYLFILEAIADDYEDLQRIVTEVTGLGARCRTTIQRSEILQGLTNLIEAGLAKAYRLSPAHPNEEIQGVPSPEKIEDSYFWITEEGRLKLQFSPWPFDERGEVLKDWSPLGS